MTLATGPILLVGCGKMGGALLAGWIDRGVAPGQITVIEPGREPRDAVGTRFGITAVADAGDLDESLAPGVILFAVKPQTMDSVVPRFRPFAGPDAVFLSIAAGKTIGYFARHLGADAAIVRAMPNTPAAVARGITVLCANPAVTADQRDGCQALLAAVGETIWIDDEALMDAVTAVSGGGPAYVFLLIECLAEAGVDAGLADDLAMRLARATVCGAGTLAAASPETAATLRRNVTSPGGTTQEALEVLMGEGGLKPLLSRAVAAATTRSRELAD